MYCSNCGKELADNAFMCPICGAPTNDGCCRRTIPADASDKDWLTTLLLSFFLGGLGIHSFYVGKTAIGVVQLFTLGGCGIWSLIDFIMIACQNYRDGEGKIIVNKQ